MSKEKICSKCNHKNTLNTNFCVNCGTAFQEQPFDNPTQSKWMGYFQYCKKVIMKPYDALKENPYQNFKEISLFALFIIGIITIFQLLFMMISVARVTTFFANGWIWENLKQIPYLKLIFNSIFMYVGMLFLITGIYYIATLILKKEVPFTKILIISVTSLIPFALSIILYSILSILYMPLSISILILGFMYTTMIFIACINQTISLKDTNKTILMHTICLSFFVLIVSLILYQIALSSMTIGFDHFIHLFQ